MPCNKSLCQQWSRIEARDVHGSGISERIFTSQPSSRQTFQSGRKTVLQRRIKLTVGRKNTNFTVKIGRFSMANNFEHTNSLLKFFVQAMRKFLSVSKEVCWIDSVLVDGTSGKRPGAISSCKSVYTSLIWAIGEHFPVSTAIRSQVYFYLWIKCDKDNPLIPTIHTVNSW